MRGQGYDGASNMRGVWNGLQTLFLKEYSSAYYIHCFAHRLQLTLVAAAKDMFSVSQFFSYLTALVNLITSSPKRLSEFQAVQREETSWMLEIGELESGSGANQIGSLHRPGTTRWSSHYQTVRNMIDMYAAVSKVLINLAENGQQSKLRGEANDLYAVAKSFDFVFHLHLMDSIFGTVDLLCQSLQRKDQNILTAVRLVSSTKTILNELRQDGWAKFIYEVQLFCVRNDVDFPDMSKPYTIGRYRQREQHISIEHYYHFDIFNQAIDCQIVELNTTFNDSTMELLALSQALNPDDSFSLFNIEDICKLASKFYSQDFGDQEIHALQLELQHYKKDVTTDANLRQISLLSDLSAALVRTNRVKTYRLIFRLIRLVLTLPVSIASTERTFSAIKHIKTAIRNKMEDDFLADSLILFVERDLTRKIDMNLVIEDFDCKKTRRAQLK